MGRTKKKRSREPAQSERAHVPKERAPLAYAPSSADKTVTALFIAALALCPFVWIAVYLGAFHVAPEGLPSGILYEAYFDKHNWWPYPFFILAIWLLVHRSWDGFNEAWLKAANVIRKTNGRKSSDEERHAIVSDTRSWRRYLVLAAWLSSFVYNAIDARPLWVMYTTDFADEQILTAVKNEPDWFSKFVFLEDSVNGYRRTYLALATPAADKLPDLAAQVPYRPSGPQYAVTILSYLQQVFLVAMAFLVLYQTLAHMAFFAYLDKLPNARRASLTIWLEHDDGFNEFGLQEFNRALNKLYWVIAACLVMPLLSKMAQPEVSELQVIGNLLVACIPLAPLVLTVVARQSWTGPCYERAQKELPDGPKRYNEQHVWPMTANNLYAAGIVVTIALTGSLIGVELISFLTSVL